MADSVKTFHTDGGGILDMVHKRRGQRISVGVALSFFPGVNVAVYSRWLQHKRGTVTVTAVHKKNNTITVAEPLPKGIRAGDLLLLS